jgi:hypothetical protein
MVKTEALILKITTEGVHLMILSFGIQGLMKTDREIILKPELECANIGSETIRTFDYVVVRIVA